MSVLSTRNSTAAVRSSLVLLLALLLGGCSPANPKGDGGTGDGGTGTNCLWDEFDDPASAAPLTFDQVIDGWFCPIEDEDWYSFETGPDDHLLTVKLCMGTCEPDVISPVQPTYAVFTREADGSAGTVVAVPPSVEVGAGLELVHCIAPGSHYIAVRDQNDDAQDIRREYHLTVSSAVDPDQTEPNDDALTAIAATPGTAQTGTIACRGDQDWYEVTLAAGQLIRVALTSPIANYQPTVKLIDSTGQVLFTETNPRGKIQDTALDRYAGPGAGTYHVVVSDDDGLDADTVVEYSLLIEVVVDNDPNEPNDEPSEAVGLTTMTCGASWSAYQTYTGTFAVVGDQDWFRVPLSGCNNGLLEAEITLDYGSLSDADAWTLQSQLQASIGWIRGHGPSACVDHTTCGRLNKGCSDGFGCAGFSNQCLSDGFCQGSSFCLNEGVCGAIMAQRQYQSRQVGGGPPPVNRALVAVPLLGDAYGYVRVSDFQSNASSPDVSYTLRIRTRQDPDTGERNNVYTPLITIDDSTSLQTAQATPIQVYDCTAGNCCTGSTWTTGNVGYQMDQDWFRYQHPCPGTDCTLRLVYQLDAGPVDLYFNIYRGSTLWYDSITPRTTGTDVTQSAYSGAYGGTAGAADCFYAFAGHTGSPFYYHVSVKDHSSDAVDWDSDQTYRFCVEKVSNVCSEPPCEIHVAPDPPGCGPP